MKSLYRYAFLATLIFVGCSDNGKYAINHDECPLDSICLNREIGFTQNILPDTYKASVKITESDTLRKGGEIEQNTKKDIANTLNDILNLSKKHGFCEGGNHDLRPNIQYKDGAARDTVGYTLSFSLECDVPSELKKEYDSFISHIDKAINKNKYLSFLSPNVNVIATSNAWQEAQDMAFVGATKIAMESAKEYTELLDKKCAVANISAINSPMPREAIKLTNMSAAATTEWALPIPKEQEINVRIQVKYICK